MEAAVEIVASLNLEHNMNTPLRRIDRNLHEPANNRPEDDYGLIEEAFEPGFHSGIQKDAYWPENSFEDEPDRNSGIND